MTEDGSRAGCDGIVRVGSTTSHQLPEIEPFHISTSIKPEITSEADEQTVGQATGVITAAGEGQTCSAGQSAAGNGLPGGVAKGGVSKRKNRNGPRSRTSPYLGVSQVKAGKYKSTCHWEAHIWDSSAEGGSGRQLHLGSFLCVKQAAKAYDRAALIMRGPAAELNQPAACYVEDPVLQSLRSLTKREMVLAIRKTQEDPLPMQVRLPMQVQLPMQVPEGAAPSPPVAASVLTPAASARLTTRGMKAATPTTPPASLKASHATGPTAMEPSDTAAAADTPTKNTIAAERPMVKTEPASGNALDVETDVLDGGIDPSGAASAHHDAGSMLFSPLRVVSVWPPGTWVMPLTTSDSGVLLTNHVSSSPRTAPALVLPQCLSPERNEWSLPGYTAARPQPAGDCCLDTPLFSPGGWLRWQWQHNSNEMGSPLGLLPMHSPARDTWQAQLRRPADAADDMIRSPSADPASLLLCARTRNVFALDGYGGASGHAGAHEHTAPALGLSFASPRPSARATGFSLDRHAGSAYHDTTIPAMPVGFAMDGSVSNHAVGFNSNGRISGRGPSTPPALPMDRPYAAPLWSVTSDFNAAEAYQHLYNS